MKMQSTENKEVSLKPSREKWPITYNGTKMRQICDFATAKKVNQKKNIFDIMVRENDCQSQII